MASDQRDAAATHHVEVGNEGRGRDHGVGDDPAGATSHVLAADAHGVAQGEDTHRHERPEDWGWNAELSTMARIGGWFSLIALALMLTATHYNHAGSLAIGLCMVAVVLGLVWDRQKRKNSWRS